MLRVFRFSACFLLLIAIACLGDFFYGAFERDTYQEQENRNFDERPNPTPKVAPPSNANLPRDRIPRSRPAGAVIGRISVPRLKLRAIVDEGVDDDTLNHAVGHIPGTAYPGQSGNVALAGHRDTFFRDLRRLQKNDEIVLETRSRKFRYRVDSIVVVEPSQTRVIAPTSKRTLTLVTCFPFHYIGNAPKRFIVRATAQ